MATFDERKTLLSRKLNYHKCGNDIHRKYGYLSQKFLENGGHHPDDIVLIEAHNLGLIHTISLITFDENMCKACSKIKELSIKCILCEKSD